MLSLCAVRERRLLFVSMFRFSFLDMINKREHTRTLTQTDGHRMHFYTAKQYRTVHSASMHPRAGFQATRFARACFHAVRPRASAAHTPAHVHIWLTRHMIDALLSPSSPIEQPQRSRKEQPQRAAATIVITSSGGDRESETRLVHLRT